MAGFCKAFREYMDGIGILQQKVAEKTGLDQSRISRLTRDQEPTSPTIQKIAGGLGVDIVYRSTGEIEFVKVSK